MKVFAISDLHLSTTTDKPMDIFGHNWENYWQKIVEDWNDKVTEQDIVLIAGDISWAMTLNQAKSDIDEIAKLNGKKIIIKGNHDYWWQSYSKIKQCLPENMYAIQNNCLRFDNVLISGSRLWSLNSATDDDNKILQRELIRTKLCLKTMSEQKKEGDVCIFMCHYPPFDFGKQDNEFTNLFEEYGISKVVYGHLHGKERGVLYLNKNNIDYYLTSCDLVNNKLVQIV